MTEESRHDLQLKFIGFLLAISLSILGWGFNNWSNAVESGMQEVMQEIRRMNERDENQTRQMYEIAKEMRVLKERQDALRERVRENEKHSH